MWKLVGIVLFGIGVIGELHEWITRNKNRQKRLDEMIVFLTKARYAMEEEKVRWIPFFLNYKSQDEIIMQTLCEIVKRLQEHRYPYGEDAWKAVFLEKKTSWDCKEESFQVLLQLGGAFFGRSKQENGEFMDSYIRQLKECKKREKEIFAEEKKVWIPVSVLGGVMLVIMLV